MSHDHPSVPSIECLENGQDKVLAPLEYKYCVYACSQVILCSGVNTRIQNTPLQGFLLFSAFCTVRSRRRSSSSSPYASDSVCVGPDLLFRQHCSSLHMCIFVCIWIFTLSFQGDNDQVPALPGHLLLKHLQGSEGQGKEKWEDIT